MKLSKRENLLKLLRREGYEEIPVEFALCPSLIESYQKNESTTLEYPDFFGIPWKGPRALIPDDTNLDRFLKYHGGSIDKDTYIDEFGVGHRSTPTSMHMTQMLYPLANAQTVEDIEQYPLPTYSHEGNLLIKEETDRIHESGLASVGYMQCSVWENAWYIRGMENLMMDMMSDDPMAECLLDKITEMSLSRALLYAKAGVDILFTGDDIGMQKTIMMSEELYLKWIQPRLKRIISEVKKIRPDILVFYHSCGFIEPMIPYLIDAGIDVLNPIQPECMDFGEIYAKYGDVLSFHGTIGTQSTMPFGTPEEVKSEVKKNLDIAGEKGGLFVAPTHLVEPEVPWENIYAYIEACKEYTKKS